MACKSLTLLLTLLLHETSSEIAFYRDNFLFFFEHTDKGTSGIYRQHPQYAC
jgi:hypothetical protein